MSTISTGTLLTTAFVVKSDLSGTLQIQTGASSANAVYIDSSQNVGIGTISPSAKLDIGSGNLNFSSTGQRITGDFSNATITNRVLFQTSTLNGQTRLSLMPNGTQTDTAIDLFVSSSDLVNVSRFSMRASIADMSLLATREGTGTYLPMTFYTGGSERIRVDTSGNVGVGTTSPAVKLDVQDTAAIARVTSTTGTNAVRYQVINTGGTSQFGRESNGGGTILSGADGYSTVLTGTGAYPMVFGTNSAERMRIDSSGNVGIGTTTMTAKLNVTASSENVALFQNSNNSPALIRFREPATTNDPYIAAYGNAMAFGKYGAGETMRIDGSGNVGIGVTPSAWLSTVKAIQLSNRASIYTDSSGNTIVGNNSFVNSSSQDTYLQTAQASAYLQGAGQHKWYNAPSGTAGNAITFTQAMTLDASGNLGIGTSSPNCVFHVVGGIGSTGGNPTSSGAAITMFYDTSNDYGVTSVLNNGVAWKQYVIRSAGLIFKTSTDSEAARFDTSGQLGIGTSSPGTTLDVNGAITGRAFGGEGGEIRLNNITNSATALLLDVDGGNNVRMYNSLATNTIFYTNAAERMRITSGGYVGIGTTSPIRQLTLSNSGSTEFVIQDSSQAVDSRNWRIFNTGTQMYFGTLNDAGSSGTDVMILNRAGNVGIGGGTPGSNPKLSMYGGIRFLNQEAAANTYTGIGSIVSDSVSISCSAVERVRITAGGEVYIGTAASSGSGGIGYSFTGVTGAPNFVINKNYAAGSDNITFRYNGTNIGTISTTTTNTAYNTSSDYRLKQDIAPMTGVLDKVAQLKPVTYKWKSDGSDGEGFIAHELAEVCPHAVTGDKDAVDEDGKPVYQGIDSSFLIATLTAAIQELNAKVIALEAKVGV